MIQKAKVADRLSLGSKLGFTVGDYGSNLYWQSISLFLMYYYTDALGLSAGTAGLIYMVASIFDGIIDPVMGAVADRSRTRWGRYRPFILLGAVPLGLSFAFLYWKPAATGLGLTAVVLAAHLLFRVCYTVIAIPYTSLVARLTSSSRERASIAGFRLIFASLAAVTVSLATQPLVARFGAGNDARGFFYLACVLATVATCIFPIVFLSTREPVLVNDGAAAPSLMGYWNAIRGNRALWMVVIASTFSSLYSTVMGKSVIYYFKYVLNDVGAAHYALTMNAAAGLLAIPAWVFVIRRTGKTAAWMIACGWGVAGAVFFALTPIHAVTPMIAFYVFMQVATMGGYLGYWGLLPDVVEYGEWRTGVRAEPFVFGFGIFFQKAALGLAVGIFGLCMDLIGYVPNRAQAPHTLAGMKVLMVAIPIFGLCATALALYFQPLKRGVHDRLVEEIIERAAAATAE